MKAWTKEQQAAIEARNSNLLVSAAAGSGKTAVLVERIIQMILKDKIDIDQLLIVTFTNAAAGEMRERIADAIVKELEKQNEKEEHLRKQITLLNKATITTLHAFCIEVVKKHFHYIDIDPIFRIGDTTETSILQLEALEELFEKEYEKDDAVFIELVESFGGTKEDTPLQELILKIYHFIQSQPKPYQWLRDRIEDFNLNEEEFQHSQWMSTIKEGICINLKGALDLLKEAQEICRRPDGPFMYMEAIEEDLKQVEDLQHALKEDMEGFYEKITDLKHKTLAKGGQEVSQILKDEVKSLREKAKDIIKAMKKDVFILSPQEYFEDIKRLYPLMRYLGGLVESFGKAYHDKKSEKGIVDFNDLEHYALEILENEKAAEDYRNRFEYIFIDEYQDSNVVQESLIDHIRRENNVFMVGDVKQSIYRFRLADPTLFIEKYENFGLEEGILNRRIDLSRNFRSRKEILDGVNYLFKHIMSKSLGEIDYNEKAYLYEGRSFEVLEDPSIEVKIIEKDIEIEELQEEIEELEDIEVEARIVADRIKRLLQEKIYDANEKTYRPIQYKDIVVLMRTTKNWADTFLEVFMKENIPSYADVSTGYFEAIEINIFMNLLKIIDNKRQDLPLLSVMRSPIGKFSVEDLMEIRIAHREGSFYDAVEAYRNTQKDILGKKLSTFLEKLKDWADEAKFMKIDELIWKLFMDTGYFYYIGAMPGGQQKQANLRVLLDRAKQFEKTSMKGLFNFIKFVEKLERSKGDMGAAKILGENDNVVRIMSIHKSKGLEFPIVIVAGLGKNFNLRDTNADVLLHKDLGLGPKFVDLELRTYRDTIAKLAMRDRIRMESLSEEMRILYVAMTRPIDKLILVGSIKNLSKQIEKWSKNINPYMLSSAKNYLDWIGMVLIKHPDAKSLREIADLGWQEDKLIKDPSKWTVSILNRQHIVQEEKIKASEKKDVKEKLQKFQRQEFTSYKEKIDAILNWEYPNERATTIPSKLSVSQIKQSNIASMKAMGYKIPNLVTRPKFMEKTKTISPAERGTILHFVLQHLDFKKVTIKDYLQEEIKMMVIKELLTEEEAESVDIAKIEALLTSDLGERMLKAERLYKEVPFNLKKKAKEVIIGLENCEDTLLIQGVIDCYFEEEGEWVLVDYKSDYVPNGDVSTIVKRYEAQLQLYQEALERITGRNVKETYLYLFNIDKAVKLQRDTIEKEDYYVEAVETI